MASAALRVAGALAIAALPVSLGAQKPASREAVQDEYVALVSQYRAGEVSAAARRLIAHDRPWVEEAVSLVERSWRDWPTGDIEAAALLHTEIAIESSIGPSDRDFHLRVARRLVDLDRNRRLPAEFQRDWYLLVARHLQSEQQLSDLAEVVDVMAARFPHDGEVLLAVGSADELFGWSREPLNLPNAGAGRSQKGYQQQAEAAFRRAVAASPELAEPRLRLGRVLNELERPEEALEVMKPLRERPADMRFKYLAALFEGAAEQRGGHLDAAVESYRTATTFFPECQTPWVALSAALRASGELAAASAMILRVADATAQCDDPWWRYKLGQASQVDKTFAQLRLEVAR